MILKKKITEMLIQVHDTQVCLTSMDHFGRTSKPPKKKCFDSSLGWVGGLVSEIVHQYNKLQPLSVLMLP